MAGTKSHFIIPSLLDNKFMSYTISFSAIFIHMIEQSTQYMVALNKPKVS